MISKAWMSKPLENGKILCTACLQGCELGEGKTGICGIRTVKDGKLMLTVYGLAAAANIDPVEKKPLYHFLPGTEILSIGTVGCNFHCTFCQNADISQYPKTKDHPVFGREFPPEAVVRVARENRCPSIAYTYNEPAVFFEYAYDTAKLAHEEGLKNVFVTSGYETPAALDAIAPYLDAMNTDLKFFREESYKKIAGARLEKVLESIRYAYSKGVWIEITTLVIPGLNDSEEELREIARFIKGLSPAIPWHLSAFHPTYKMLDRPRTPARTLVKAYDIGKEEGLEYVYVGNIVDEDRTSTRCPKCGTMVIDRRGNLGQIVVDRMKEKGKCPGCGYEIAGVWE